MPWSISNIMANDVQNSESTSAITQAETESLLQPIAENTSAQMAHEAQIPVFPLQEAAENLRQQQEELAVPAAAIGSEAEAFVDQVIGEIRQSVVSNEAERTVPVQLQETAAQEALNVTLQEPMATDAPEEPSAQDNDHHIVIEAAAQNPEKDIQEASKRDPDMESPADAYAKMPSQAGNTKKASHPTAAPIHPNEASVLEVQTEGDNIAPRELNEGFFDALTEHLETAATNGQDELYIQLKPEVLGGLSVRLLMTDEGLHAQVRTSNQNLQAIMNAELSQLADALRDKGIQVAQLECVYEFMTGNEQFAGRQQHFQDGRENSPKPRRTYAIEGVSVQPLISYENMVPTETMEQEGVEFSA
jgi:flagellar hook-length control protein FliK